MAIIAQGNGFYFTEGSLDYCVDYIEMFPGSYDLRLLSKNTNSTQWSYTDGVEFDSRHLHDANTCDNLLADAIAKFNKYLAEKHGKAPATAPANGLARIEWSLNNLSYNSETKQIGGI